MGGLAAALLADILGGLLLILGGPAAIWRTLWVFWTESAAAGVVAAVSLRSGMASLSDDAWLAYAAQSLDAEARRGPSTDQTPYQFQLQLEQRHERLAQLAALDRRTPEGAAAFAHERSMEGNVASSIFGCAFLGFSAVHAAFLLMLGLFQAAFSLGSAMFLSRGFGSLSDPEASSGITLDTGSLPFLFLAMAVVLVVGLAPLRRSAQLAESETAMRTALVRTFILQIVIIVGAVPAIFLGSAPLALAFVVVKTVADVVPAWRRRRSAAR